ncbi:hypothetical protein C8R43DRAFT_1116387 [Mycena crocata]|nr:hypothetical protein C8R43DRAFT_1116387 [Mycena crocata]
MRPPERQKDSFHAHIPHNIRPSQVPLNYPEPHGAKVAIAMTRYPATVPADSPQYRGPILINPGGPGGSGVDIVNFLGAALAQTVGPEFDILSVARSTPRASFFETHMERLLFGHATVRDLNASADVLGRLGPRHKYTPAWPPSMRVAWHFGAYQHGREKLRYWGFSPVTYECKHLIYLFYSDGSVLGAVFAAIFPDKVERLIIDGVVDAENYFDTLWSNNLLDADKTLQIFFDSCVAAGPTGCAFYAPTPEAISQNLTALYDSVRVRPVPVKTASGYGVIDYNSLCLIVLSSLYWPLTLFRPLAVILAGLARGDGAPLIDFLKPSPFECSCDPSEHQFDSILDSQVDVAILCSDDVHLGSVFASIRISCTGWDIPKQHFQGPVSGNTSFPLLLIGNTADLVTPLINLS